MLERMYSFRKLTLSRHSRNSSKLCGLSRFGSDMLLRLQAPPSITPKQLLLELLRVAPDPLAVRDLVAVGRLFGFEDNAVRVALARLVRRGLVASRQGRYGLTEAASHLGRWVETWREGDRRLRAWKGDWLCVLHPQGAERTPRRRSTQALERLRFRLGNPHLWVRPNNLRAGRGQMELELVQLGLVDDAEVFVGQEFSSALHEKWAHDLWPTDMIQRDLRESLAEIERSRNELDTMPDIRALVESFLVGSRALHLLALDPLLPDEICDGTARRELTEAMKEYERIGKALWSPDLVAALLTDATNDPQPKEGNA